MTSSNTTPRTRDFEGLLTGLLLAERDEVGSIIQEAREESAVLCILWGSEIDEGGL